MLIYILVAILSGVSIVVSRIINSRLGDEIGVFQSTFYGVGPPPQTNARGHGMLGSRAKAVPII